MDAMRAMPIIETHRSRLDAARSGSRARHRRRSHSARASRRLYPIPPAQGTPALSSPSFLLPSSSPCVAGFAEQGSEGPITGRRTHILSDVGRRGLSGGFARADWLEGALLSQAVVARGNEAGVWRAPGSQHRWTATNAKSTRSKGRTARGVLGEEVTPCVPLRSLRPLRFKVVALPPDGLAAAGDGSRVA